MTFYLIKNHCSKVKVKIILYSFHFREPAEILKHKISPSTLIWIASEIHCSKQPRKSDNPLQRCHLFWVGYNSGVSDDPHYYSRSMCRPPKIEMLVVQIWRSHWGPQSSIYNNPQTMPLRAC